MADTLKQLGQAAPAAGANADLYTVPAATSTVLSRLIACNTGAASTKIRVFVRTAAAAVGNAVVYDLTIMANETLPLPLEGIALEAGRIITVYSLAGGVTFTASGDELT